MDFTKRYKQLNKQQQAAVDSTEGSLLVIAGPGSGKTELLGLRTANIVKKTDTPISSVLTLTFTNSATSNMKQRLVDVIGDDGYRSSVYTFHSFCSNIIDSYPDIFFKGVRFSPADQVKKIKIIKAILDTLPTDDPLRTRHPSYGYVFLKDIERSILTLQEEGLTPQCFARTVEENEKQLPVINRLIEDIFSQRISKKTVELINNIAVDLPVEENRARPSLLGSTVRAVTSICAEEDTKKLSQWKQKMTRRSEDGLVLKDSFDIEKMKSLSKIYFLFQERMAREGYYSFSDMILEVISALESNTSLLADIQERYLYLQADEFQDTNGAQMQLLKFLTTGIENPNICAVGDDDQTIYRFQGADISNILDFQKIYPQAKIITLGKNYRSNADIIATAKKVIDQAEERITTSIKEVNKNITSAKDGCCGVVTATELKTEVEELSYVAEKIKKEVETVPLEEVAVIARTNSDLQKLAPYLVAQDIPYFAERKENIIEQRHILEIFNVIKFTVDITKKENSSATELLPEILSYSFFQIPRESVWEVLNRHYNKREDLIKTALSHKDTKEACSFLLELSALNPLLPAENLIDIIIGNQSIKINKRDFCSPFKDFYFSGNIDKEYINLFSSLQCLITSVRDHQKKETLKGEDVIELIGFCKENDTPIINKDPLVSKDCAVQLITAHGAKGREFESVFVINCQQKKWGSQGRSGKISLPLNIPAKNSGSRDDEVRLFYVAVTRAKKNLYFTFHNLHHNSERSLRLDLLSDIEVVKDSPRIILPTTLQDTTSKSVVPTQASEKNFLLSVVEDYRLSATAFNKFLNVVDGGPSAFVKDSLLRFPHAKNIYAAYGTAVHNTVQETYSILKKSGALPSEKIFLKIFTDFLKKERLTDKDFSELTEKGKDELLPYYKKNKKDFSPEHIVEKSFNNQGVFIDDIQLTGKIDKIIVDNSNKLLRIYDIKTGESFSDWKTKGDRAKIKAWQYRNQLIFYKILTEKSRDFSNYTTAQGFLEFIKSNSKGELVTLPLDFNEDDVERTLSLIKIVGGMIKNLNFPSTEEYKKTAQGITDFENYLLATHLYE